MSDEHAPPSLAPLRHAGTLHALRAAGQEHADAQGRTAHEQHYATLREASAGLESDAEGAHARAAAQLAENLHELVVVHSGGVTGVDVGGRVTGHVRVHGATGLAIDGQRRVAFWGNTGHRESGMVTPARSHPTGDPVEVELHNGIAPFASLVAHVLDERGRPGRPVRVEGVATLNNLRAGSAIRVLEPISGEEVALLRVPAGQAHVRFEVPTDKSVLDWPQTVHVADAEGAPRRVFRAQGRAMEMVVDIAPFGSATLQGRVGELWLMINRDSNRVVDARVLSPAVSRWTAPALGRSVKREKREVRVKMQNRSGVTASLDWVDPNGTLKNFASPWAGMDAEVITYPGHVWVVRDPQGHVLRTYEVSDRPMQAFDVPRPSTRAGGEPRIGPKVDSWLLDKPTGFSSRNVPDAVDRALDPVQERVYSIDAQGTVRGDGYELRGGNIVAGLSLESGEQALQIAWDGQAGTLYAATTRRVFAFEPGETPPQPLPTALPSNAGLALAVDERTQRLYLSDASGLRRVPATGGSVEQLLGPGDRRGLALDSALGALYWIEGNGVVKRWRVDVEPEPRAILELALTGCREIGLATNISTGQREVLDAQEACRQATVAGEAAIRAATEQAEALLAAAHEQLASAHVDAARMVAGARDAHRQGRQAAWRTRLEETAKHQEIEGEALRARREARKTAAREAAEQRDAAHVELNAEVTTARDALAQAHLDVHGRAPRQD